MSLRVFWPLGDCAEKNDATLGQSGPAGKSRSGGAGQGWQRTRGTRFSVARTTFVDILWPSWRRFMVSTLLGTDAFDTSGSRSLTAHSGGKAIATHQQLSRSIGGFVKNGRMAFRSDLRSFKHAIRRCAFVLRASGS
jgi:hypothetical protein